MHCADYEPELDYPGLILLNYFLYFILNKQKKAVLFTYFQKLSIFSVTNTFLYIIFSHHPESFDNNKK